MQRTFIVCKDPVYLRMLELELSEGFSGDVTVFDSYTAFCDHFDKYGIPEDEGTVCIFDLDTERSEKTQQKVQSIVKRYGSGAVSFGYGAQTSYKTAFEGDFLRRPFDTDRLKQTLSAMPQFSFAAKTKYPDYEPAGDIKLNDRTKTAYFRGELLDLTVKEYMLLSYLMRMRGSNVSREEIRAAVWDNKNDAKSNSVDVYIRFLRSKIDDKYSVRLIHSIRGSGYRIN